MHARGREHSIPAAFSTRGGQTNRPLGMADFARHGVLSLSELSTLFSRPFGVL
jgi:hypothetical protein